MTQMVNILLLAACVAFALIFTLAAISGAVMGRLKSEPSRPWVRRSERPLRFVALMLFNVGAALLFVFASVIVARHALR